MFAAPRTVTYSMALQNYIYSLTLIQCSIVHFTRAGEKLFASDLTQINDQFLP